MANHSCTSVIVAHSSLLQIDGSCHAKSGFQDCLRPMDVPQPFCIWCCFICARNLQHKSELYTLYIIFLAKHTVPHDLTVDQSMISFKFMQRSSSDVSKPACPHLTCVTTELAFSKFNVELCAMQRYTACWFQVLWSTLRLGSTELDGCLDTVCFSFFPAEAVPWVFSGTSS